MTQTTSAGRLAELKAHGQAALIGYLPVGFPSVEGSMEAAGALVAAGVDIIELGIPYSDPVMDGPVIQQATQIALDGGVRLVDAFAVVEHVARLGVPVMVMTYFNPIFRYGLERFSRDLAQAGGAGVITPDLIPDEAAEWVAATDKYTMERVFLVAPSSTDERIALTSRATTGFVYAASTMGVTGTRTHVGSQARSLVERTRASGAQHVCVGLGVSTATQAAEVASYADGVIVGSAFVAPLLTDLPWNRRVATLSEVVRSLADGVQAGSQRTGSRGTR